MPPPKDPIRYALYVERQRKSQFGKHNGPKTQEHCDNISRGKTGKPSGKKGKKVSPEGCRNISESKKGKPSWNKGIPMSEEARIKLSETRINLKLKHSDETKDKMRKSHEGIPRPQEVKDKISKSNLGKHHTKEHIENNRLSHLDQEPWNKGIPSDEDAILKMVETKIGGFWYGNVKNDLTLGELFRRTKDCKDWTNDVLNRDGRRDAFTGEICKNPEAHHIESIAKIIRKYNLKTLDDCHNCKELLDRNNGMTVEYETHVTKFHCWAINHNF